MGRGFWGFGARAGGVLPKQDGGGGNWGVGCRVQGRVRAWTWIQGRAWTLALLTQEKVLTTDYSLLIAEFIKEVSPLLPNPCHYQDYDRSVFPRSAWLRRMPPEDMRG